MLFTEALKEMIDRKQVARTAWESEGKYVVVMPGMSHVWQILTQPSPNAGNWLPSVEDLNADDWQVK